uniref:RPW8 domain-containing protein n=2 Tax=Brassica oleracea var. oleracea TaxID=109376 RepID=A0A0D3DBC0_BRAOL
MNDLVDLGVSSVAGAVVSELLKAVIEEAKLVVSFKSVYMELASTMEKMLPIIMEIEMLQRAEELQDLDNIINEARLLVRKCSQVKRWNLPSKAKYTRKIDETNKKMLKFCQIQLQLIMLRNQRLIMHRMGLESSYHDELLSPRPYDNLPLDTMKAIQSRLKSLKRELNALSVSPPVSMDLFSSVPEIDKVLVGLDFPLMEVKKKLLDDDDPVPSSLVVSAPPGCGKTTLVTQLCHDDEVKEKFEYIFFCVASSAPTFRNIVQNLLEHNGYEAPAYENDSQAVDGLRKLLEELKEDGPILLVLDDLWQGAERTGGLDISFGSSYMWIMWMLVSEKLLNVIPFGIHEHEDSFYNDFLVTRHSILRDLAQSKSEEHHERERLNLEIREDAFPDWCLDLKQPISARLLSISADWMFSSTWVEMECPNVEALVLNLSSSSYALPNFITTMKKLKVVIIINDGHYPAKLTNLSCLSSLPNLKRIRFEKISINSLDILLSPLCSLEKLSMFRCRFREVSYNIEDIAIPEALPSLQEIDIDHCYDLDELPAWVSEVVLLKKLSITNCGKLSVLPKALGNLSYELPESIERLGNLRLLDILIRMCPGCELPDPVSSSESSEVDCDEDQNEESESVI